MSNCLAITALISANLAFHYVVEFLKATFFVGIPVVFILGFMVKKPRFSPAWIISAVLLLGLAGFYVTLLMDLPQRVEVRQIVSEGGALVAEGKYDQAIEEYKKLGNLGKVDDMTTRIAGVEKEKKASDDLAQARHLLGEGKVQEARTILKGIPEGTRAAVEADRLKTQLGS